MTSHPELLARTGTVHAPGARLFYQVRGSGPVLMMLCGGAAGADGFGSVASCLAADYTVVTCDRRGLSRSPLDDPSQDPAITIAKHSEDVHRILTALDAAPALVFGSSIGAVIGLDLLIRHPGDVRLLVAHEPPAGSPQAGEEDEVPAAAGGAGAALRLFAASLTPKTMMPLPYQADDGTRACNSEFFMAHDGPAVQRYELDSGTLKRLTAQVVIGGGSARRRIYGLGLRYGASGAGRRSPPRSAVPRRRWSVATARDPRPGVARFPPGRSRRRPWA
jgi:pimeloyl-ACP methyl ester carboxylesterase